MPRVVALVGLLLFGATSWAQGFPEPRTVRVNHRLQVLLGSVQHANPLNQGYMINSTVIVGDNGVILIDSGGTAEVGRHIAAAVRRITDKPVTHVVNTHHHGDHYLGNVAFEGATSINSEMCRRMVVETGEPKDLSKASDSYSGFPADLTRPAILMVYLPDDKVLIAGDVLVNRVVPTLQDGFLKNWIGTLDELLALDAVHFVPGHGDIMAVSDVAQLRDAMIGFYDGVRQGFRSGLSEEKIRNSLDFSMWNKLERAYVIGRNVNRAYLEVEADSFDE